MNKSSLYARDLSKNGEIVDAREIIFLSLLITINSYYPISIILQHIRIASCAPKCPMNTNIAETSFFKDLKMVCDILVCLFCLHKNNEKKYGDDGEVVTLLKRQKVSRVLRNVRAGGFARVSVVTICKSVPRVPIHGDYQSILN